MLVSAFKLWLDSDQSIALVEGKILGAEAAVDFAGFQDLRVFLVKELNAANLVVDVAVHDHSVNDRSFRLDHDVWVGWVYWQCGPNTIAQDHIEPVIACLPLEAHDVVHVFHFGREEEVVLGIHRLDQLGPVANPELVWHRHENEILHKFVNLMETHQFSLRSDVLILMNSDLPSVDF